MLETALDLHAANLPTAVLAGGPMLVTAALFVFVQQRLPRDTRTLLFELFLFSMLWWQCFDVMVRLSATAETAQFWRGMLRFGQIFCVPLGLHFSLVYAELDRLAGNRYFLTALYGQALVLFGLYQNGYIVERLVYHPGWGWLANGAEFPPVADVFVVIAAIISIGTAGVLVWNRVRQRAIDDKRQAATLMAVGYLIPAAGGVFTEAVLPLAGLHQVPITSSTITIFALCAAMALTRFHMFSVSTPAAAKAVLDTITDPLLIARSDGRLLFANQHALEVFGIQRDAVQGFRLDTLFSSEGERIAFFAGRWKQALMGERFAGIDAKFVMEDGAAADFLVSLAPIPLTRTGERGVALVAHDVSRLKRIESDLVAARDEAENANRAKSMFLANMSHELRTPLNAIIGYAELLEEDVEGEEAEADLARIHSSGRYLLTLINDVLDLAKVESGKLEVENKPFDLRILLDELTAAARQLASRNGNDYIVELPPSCQPVLGDRIRTRQVLLNLLSNACKFTQDGSITLTVQQDDTTTTIAVADTGIGMNDEQLSKLFGSFIQVHEKNHGKYGGTGLGLALSRKLCQLMGGDIVVTSMPGEGSTFTMTAPTG